MVWLDNKTETMTFTTQIKGQPLHTDPEAMSENINKLLTSR